jgi:CubicO group peptidase (beta-lactamase class C family)
MKASMKILFAIILTIQSAQALFSQDSTTYKMDELLNAYRRLGKFNGSVLVAKKGKILLEKGYGFKNFSDSSLNDANTIFQIASVTKQFTATVILKLIELKKLALTDRVSKFFPDFPKGDSITIENLLTHTSGISDHFTDRDLKPSSPVSEETIQSSIKEHGLDFSPGSDWRYTNKGYQLLGFIIQQVSSMTYFEAARKFIFTPLKMRSSGFDFSHLTNHEKATGYWSYPENALTPGADIIDSAASFAAGSIYSTVRDLYKWHEGLQNDEIVSGALLENAYTPRKNRYGFGLFIDSISNKRINCHSGDIFGFKSDLERVPEDDICIVLLANIEDPNIVFISKKLFSILYHEPYDQPAKNEIRLSPEILKQYIGSYEMQPGRVVGITLENGHLMATTDQKQEMYVQVNNHFIVDDGTHQIIIQFDSNPKGEINSLYFYNGGQKITCKKIK